MSIPAVSVEASMLHLGGRGPRADAIPEDTSVAPDMGQGIMGGSPRSVDQDAVSVTDTIISSISGAVDHSTFDRSPSEAKFAFYGAAANAAVAAGQSFRSNPAAVGRGSISVPAAAPNKPASAQGGRPASRPGQPSIEESHFHTEHARLVRQLFNSKNRETDMIKHITRLKEALVNSALRLQVAQRVINADETTIRELRKEASEARREQMASSKREEDAVRLIESLRIEISALKRQLRDRTADAGATFSINNAFLTESDAEVTRMLERHGREPLRAARGGEDENENGGGSPGAGDKGSPPKPLMPFQEWKLQHFIWAPDQPPVEQMSSAADLAHELQKKEEAARNALIDEVLANGLPNRRQKKRNDLNKTIAELLSSSMDKSGGSTRPRSSGRVRVAGSEKLPGISIRNRAAASPTDL